MRNVLLVGIAGCAVLLAGCARKNEFQPPPPPEVGVAHPIRKDVTLYEKFPGRLEAVETIELQARIKGYLRSIEMHDGQLVKKGDLLFTIEDDPYKADVAAAEAQLAKAKAMLKLAESTLKRNKQAFESKAVSELDVLSAQAKYDSAEGSVLEAKAALDNARLRLSYTKVYAPMDGRISRHLYGVGDLVGETGSSVLASLVAEAPIYAYFAIDERTALPYLAKAGRSAKIRESFPAVKIELADGTLYEDSGKIDYLDPKFDPETGTARARAVFSNVKRKLIAGLYAKVLVPQERKGAILIPKIAVSRDMRGAYVLVVDAEEKVESRYVEPGPETGPYRIVEKGLSPDDRIVVEGIQRARPGMAVRTVAASVETAK